MNVAILSGGQRIFTHGPEACAGRNCCIHNPSSHHMVEWPQFWREDAGFMERICPHGIGHPDPDDLTFRVSQDFSEQKWSKVHGCDGCCHVESE